jgi:hypothetical protein
MDWKMALGLSGILLYFFLLSHHGLRTYFNGDDVMNLVSLHGYWHWPWWRNAVEALVVVTPTYRPMGDVFYRTLYSVFGFHPVPFRVACYVLMVLNLGLFFRFALMLSRSREAALLSTLVFSFHAALSNLYFSTGTVYDILCVGFTIAALTRYVSVRRSGRELQAKDIVIFLLLYGGALDSKEMAATLPPALVLYEAILAPDIPAGRLWRRALPALLATALTVPALAVKTWALSDNPGYSPWESPAYLLSNTSHYVGMLVFREQPFGPARLVLLVVLACCACIAARRPLAFFGLCYGFVALLPLAPLPPRDGFVLYLPLVGFALFSGEILAAIRQAVGRFLPVGARRPLWIFLSQAGFFAALMTVLFVIHSRHWHDQTQDRGREDAAMREVVRLVREWHPALPAGTRLLFLDDPLPKNWYTLLFLIQAAYHDPSLWVERQNNSATPIDPAGYAIFDYLVWIRDGKLEERRLPPIRWEGAAVPVSFAPSVVERGQPIQMRAGSYSDATVDIEYQTTLRFSAFHGVALRWANLNANGVATLSIPRLQDPATIQITAVRASGDVWRKAYGGFVVR